MGPAVSIERVRQAAAAIDRVFLDTPQFACEPLSASLGVETVLKVECVNPIRSFKGRGASWFIHSLGADRSPIVCASAGNFGQAMAYACRNVGRPLTVFAASTANRLKVERMRGLGADVIEGGDDFDAAKDAARRHAASAGALFVEDGREPAIAEGAGTIAIELLKDRDSLDAVFVPLGNGALVIGVGAWFKRFSPHTRVVAVAAKQAPAMALSWQARSPVEAPSRTVADGIAVRVPVPEAVAGTLETVDAVELVDDEAMLEAMRGIHLDAGLVVEPAAAAGVAAIGASGTAWTGGRVAAILTGGNLTAEQIRAWL